MSYSKPVSNLSQKKAYEDLMRYYWLYPYKTIHRMICMNEHMEPKRVIGIGYMDNTNVYEQKDDSNFLMYDSDIFRKTMENLKPESLHMDYVVDTFAKNMNFYGMNHKKEVVFDIDLTDFQRFCDCDGKKQICSVCWLHIEGSVLILNHFLIDIMCYNKGNILWVFSGGKGIHCIVNNTKSINLNEDERMRLHQQVSIGEDDDRSIIDYVEENARNHPEFMKSLETHFLENVIRKRRLLENPNFTKFCLTRFAGQFKAFTLALEKAWTNYDTGLLHKKRKLLNPQSISESKWSILCELEKELRCTTKPSQIIIIRLFHPIVDTGPLGIRHKFKIPFSIHSTTKNVSLPVEKETLITTEMVENPLKLSKLLERRDPEMDRYANSVKILANWVDNYNSV